MHEQSVQLEELKLEHAIEEAFVGLRSRTRRKGDDPVRLELIEDDLREGFQAVESVREYFDDVVALLANPSTCGRDVIDFVDDPRTVEHVEYLVALVNNLRRRLMQLATRGG